MAQIETEENVSSATPKLNCNDLSDTLDVDLHCQECDRTMLHKHEAYIHYIGKAHLKRVEMLKIQQQLKNEFKLTDEEMIYCARCNKNLESPQVAKSHYESASHESNVNMIQTSEIVCEAFSSHMQQTNLEEHREANLAEHHQMQNMRPHNGVEGASLQNFDTSMGMHLTEVEDSDKNECIASNAGESSSHQEEAQSSVASPKNSAPRTDLQKTLEQNLSGSTTVPPFKRLKKDDVTVNTTNSEAATTISSPNQIKKPPFKAIKATTSSSLAKPPFSKNQGSLSVKKTSAPPFKALKAANSVTKALKRVQGCGVSKTTVASKAVLKKGTLTSLERIKFRLGSGANKIPVASQRFTGDAANVLRLQEVSATSGNPNKIPVGSRLRIPPRAGDTRDYRFLHGEQPPTIRTSLGNESLLPVASRPPTAESHPFEERLLTRYEWAAYERAECERELGILRHQRHAEERELRHPRLQIAERELRGSRGPVEVRDPHDDQFERARILPHGCESTRDLNFEDAKTLDASPSRFLRDPVFARASLAPRELISQELARDPHNERAPVARKAELVYPERLEGARGSPVYDYYAERREREYAASIRWHDDLHRRPTPSPALEQRELLTRELLAPRSLDYPCGFPPRERVRSPIHYPFRERRRLESPISAEALPMRPRYAAQELIRSRERLIRRPVPAESKAKATSNLSKQPPFKKTAVASTATATISVQSQAPKKAAPPPFKQPVASRTTRSFPKQTASESSTRGVTAVELVNPGTRVLKRFNDEMSSGRGSRENKEAPAGPSDLVMDENRPRAPFPPRQPSKPPFAGRLEAPILYCEELIRDRST